MTPLQEAMERCRCWQHYRDIKCEMHETDELKAAMLLYHRIRELEAALAEANEEISNAHEWYAKHQARIRELEAALRKLRNEVGGLRPFEAEMRAAISNTNWECLFARVAIADSVLGSSVETDPKPRDIGRCVNWPCAFTEGHSGPCSTS